MFIPFLFLTLAGKQYEDKGNIYPNNSKHHYLSDRTSESWAAYLVLSFPGLPGQGSTIDSPHYSIRSVPEFCLSLSLFLYVWSITSFIGNVVAIM